MAAAAFFRHLFRKSRGVGMRAARKRVAGMAA